MKTVLIIFLLLAGIALFIADRKRWISSRTIASLVRISPIIAALAAILVFVIPAQKSTEESTYGPVFLDTRPLNTVVGETRAALVGEITDDGGDQDLLDVWFEYWKTPADIFETPPYQVEGKGIYSITVENLEPCTTYHYRAVAKNRKGISYGEERTFTTKCPQN